MPGYLKTVLKVLLSALSLWLVFRQIDSRQLWQVLSQVHPGQLLLALGLYLVSRVLGAERLRLLFRQIGLELGLRPSLKLYWLGMYYNLFLPGGIGGDGYKVYLLNRLTGLPVKSLVTASLLDRVLGLLPLGYGLALLGFYLLPDTPYLQDMAYLRWWLLPAIPLGQVLAGWLLERFFPAYRSALGAVTLQSLGVQGSQMLAILVLVQAVGAAGPMAGYLFIFLLSSVVSILPFTIGGAGARELTFLLGAKLFGLPTEAAVAVSLLFYLITALVSLSGVVFSFNLFTSTNDLRA